MNVSVTPLQQLINLEGKTALVTGGAMGIGFGIAWRLAEAGAKIVIVDINEDAGNKAVQKLCHAEKQAVFVHCDVAREDQVGYATDIAAKTYGTVDILVNNAGIYPMIPVMQMSIGHFESILSVNLKSAFLFTKAIAEIMIAKKRGGKIINITSIDALHPSSIGLAVYDASKHGLWGFTKNMALELASYNIQVNAIAPGAILTPGTGEGASATLKTEAILKKFLEKIPMRRIGEPDDIGKAALFLASDFSSYMTGSQIIVDGGALLT